MVATAVVTTGTWLKELQYGVASTEEWRRQRRTLSALHWFLFSTSGNALEPARLEMRHAVNNSTLLENLKGILGCLRTIIDQALERTQRVWTDTHLDEGRERPVYKFHYKCIKRSSTVEIL